MANKTNSPRPRFRVTELSDGPAIFDGEKHFMSGGMSKTAADSLAAVLNDAAKIDLPSDRIIFAIAKAFGSDLRVAVL